MASDQHISGPFLGGGGLMVREDWGIERDQDSPATRAQEQRVTGRTPLCADSLQQLGQLDGSALYQAQSKGAQGLYFTGSAGLDSRSEGPDGTTVWPLRGRHCHRLDPPVLVLLLRTTCCCSPHPAPPRTCSSSPRRAPGRPRPAAR